MSWLAESEVKSS